MAFPVSARTTGELITASIWNADLKDNINALKTGGVIFDRLRGAEQSTNATGTEDNFTLSAECVLLRCTNANPLTFTGLAGGADGMVLEIANRGASTVRVLHDSNGSSASNRIICPSTQGQIIGAGGAMTLRYDGTSNRWILISVLPGRPISYAVTWTSAGSPTPDIGNGSLAGSYQQLGTQVRAQIALTGGSSTAWGNSANGWTFSVPLTSASGVDYIGLARLVDLGTALYTAVALLAGGGSTMTLTPTSGGASTPSGPLVHATIPFTWTESDTLRLDIMYQAA